MVEPQYLGKRGERARVPTSGTAEILSIPVQPSLTGLVLPAYHYPGLRPGLLSDVPTGLDWESVVLTQTLKPSNSSPLR